MDAIADAHPLKRFAQWVLRKELEQARKSYLRVERNLATARASLNDTYKELQHERRRLR